MDKQLTNIVWFKRDLRFTDNEPLYFAQKTKIPLLLIYIFEPSIMSYDDSDVRHWRFIYESLKEMNDKLNEWFTSNQYLTLIDNGNTIAKKII